MPALSQEGSIDESIHCSSPNIFFDNYLYHFKLPASGENDNHLFVHCYFYNFFAIRCVGSQAVVTQFGAIVGKPYTNAGIYLKIPFLWKVIYLDKRIYREAQSSVQVPTKDGYFISLDEVFNWRIGDPSLFIQTMPTINKARMMIKNNISGAIRQAVSGTDLLSIIRSNNKVTPITTFLNKGVSPLKKIDSVKMLGIDLTITIGREETMKKIRNDVSEYVKSFGVTVEGVLIRSVLYDAQVEKSIYARMRVERLRKAAQLRASGKAQAEYTDGLIKMKYQEIIAPAYQESLVIKGKAEAEALVTQALAFGKNQSFYNYWRTLRVYKESLPQISQGMILSMDSPFLKWIKEGGDSPNNDGPANKD